MNDVIDVVGISGGKDSTATALFAFENLEVPPRLLFCDTGIEAPITYEYIDYLDEKFKELMGGGIERVKADFSERLAKRQAKLIANGELVRAEFTVATGNPFLDLCIFKGRFPSSQARFCTGELKLEPVKSYLRGIVEQGNTAMNWSGERAEESLSRSKKPVKEVLFETEKGVAYTYRPILRWKTQDCFNTMKRFGIKPNPLYEQGFTRVGCFPCIMSRKAEIKMISELYPEVIEKLAQWEEIVSKAGRRECGSTFYPRTPISEKVEWSKTSRGGKQYQIEFED